eukprot:jgi/Mesvir1/18424/Mv14291-RA.2
MIKMEECLRLLAGSTDEERLVGLLLVTRVVTSADDAVVCSILDAISTSFLTRLLRARGQEGAQGAALAQGYRQLALSVLAALMRSPAGASSTKSLKLVPEVAAIIKERSVRGARDAPAQGLRNAPPGAPARDVTAPEEAEPLVGDAYEVMLAVASCSAVGLAAARSSGILTAISRDLACCVSLASNTQRPATSGASAHVAPPPLASSAPAAATAASSGGSAESAEVPGKPAQGKDGVLPSEEALMLPLRLLAVLVAGVPAGKHAGDETAAMEVDDGDDDELLLHEEEDVVWGRDAWRTTVWQSDPRGAQNACWALSEAACHLHSEAKFLALTTLSVLLQAMPPSAMVPPRSDGASDGDKWQTAAADTDRWTAHITAAVRDVLQSHVGEEHLFVALEAAGSLVSALGPLSLLPPPFDPCICDIHQLAQAGGGGGGGGLLGDEAQQNGYGMKPARPLDPSQSGRAQEKSLVLVLASVLKVETAVLLHELTRCGCGASITTSGQEGLGQVGWLARRFTNLGAASGPSLTNGQGGSNRFGGGGGGGSGSSTGMGGVGPAASGPSSSIGPEAPQVASASTGVAASKVVQAQQWNRARLRRMLPVLFLLGEALLDVLVGGEEGEEEAAAAGSEEERLGRRHGQGARAPAGGVNAGGPRVAAAAVSRAKGLSDDVRMPVLQCVHDAVGTVMDFLDVARQAVEAQPRDLPMASEDIASGGVTSGEVPSRTMACGAIDAGSVLMQGGEGAGGATSVPEDAAPVAGGEGARVPGRGQGVPGWLLTACVRVVGRYLAENPWVYQERMAALWPFLFSLSVSATGVYLPPIQYLLPALSQLAEDDTARQGFVASGALQPMLAFMRRASASLQATGKMGTGLPAPGVRGDLAEAVPALWGVTESDVHACIWGCADILITVIHENELSLAPASHQFSLSQLLASLCSWHAAFDVSLMLEDRDKALGTAAALCALLTCTEPGVDAPAVTGASTRESVPDALVSQAFDVMVEFTTRVAAELATSAEAAKLLDNNEDSLQLERQWSYTGTALLPALPARPLLRAKLLASPWCQALGAQLPRGGYVGRLLL